MLPEKIPYMLSDNKMWIETKEKLNGLIHPKYFDFAENHNTFYNIGIVEIFETNERINGYSNHRHCRIKGNEKLLYVHHNNNIEIIDNKKESKYDGDEIEYWVWQTTGSSGDDYSGFLLLPMLNDKFWMIGYEC